MKRIEVIAFTDRGKNLANKLRQAGGDFTFNISENETALEFSKRCFSENLPALFIGAMGIAVRSIKDFIEDKLTDIPVLVMDEAGEFIIPVLSGHWGLANDLARDIGDMIKAQPVITTASDTGKVFAIDVFAKKNALTIKNKEGIKKVTGKLLSGHPITIEVNNNNLPADVDIGTGKGTSLLALYPKAYVLGIGCKRDTDPIKIKDFVEDFLSTAGVSIEEIYCIASIDIKDKEPGILDFAKANHIPFNTYDSQTLKDTPGDFNESSFVKDITGVGSVCERAAICGCEGDGELVVEKTCRDGICLALAKRNWRLKFE